MNILYYLLKGLEDAVIITDSNLKIKEWLCGSSSIFQLPPSRAKDRNLRNLFKQHKKSTLDFNKGTAFKYVKRDKIKYVKMIQKKNIEKNVLWIFKDITQLKFLEDYLDTYHDNIQHELNLKVANSENRVSVLREKVKLLEEKLQINKKYKIFAEFIKGVVHELKTPVGVVSSYIALLMVEIDNIFNVDEMISKKNEAENKKNEIMSDLEIIKESAKQAVEFTDSLNKITVDQFIKVERKFDLIQYLKDIIRFLRPQWVVGGHNINIHSNKKIFIKSKPGAFYHIFTNLINNSIHHAFANKKYGNINIFFKLKNKILKIDYRNDGIPIQEKDIQNIFKSFFTTVKDKGGSGIGLHLIYNLVKEDLRGEIFCKNLPDGKGVQFVITIPVKIVTEKIHR